MNESLSALDEKALVRGSRGFHRVNAAFFAAGLATFAILYSVQPVFPAFASTFRESPAAASLTLSVTTTFLAVTLPVAGALSDAVGRKGIMAYSLVISSILCLASAFAPNFASLVAVRALLGVALSGIPAVAMAYLSEEVDKGSLGLAMGLYISGNSIGGLAGRLLVSFVADVSTWRMGIGIIAAASLVSSLFFWRSLPPSRHFHAQPLAGRQLLLSFGRAFQDRGLVYLYLVGALLMGGFVTLFNYIGFRLLAKPYGLSQSVIGLIFLVYLFGSVSSSWMGRLADQVGRQKVLVLNVLIMLVGALVTLDHNLLAIVFGIALFTFGFFGGHSIASSWVGRRAVWGKGQASSMYLLFYYIGGGIGGSAGGILWSVSSWAGVVGMIAGALVLALAFSWRLATLTYKK